ncbi:unnamed protein product [Medioppia subpectinata]|uniref:Transporter n=1 Tax=Medioppia subpectinata TaxID=1979941 RepID=A0A7R9KXN9_9ACAR|nr:unnamed protein product [Medioppia subpectinata]CAG2111419.1 unnamed protein product [Medioppia subpectinata]
MTFPYLCYNNGGGAFLIPFIAMMLLAGFPLMFMELAFGQYASLSPVVIFERFCPLFSGIGYGMVIVSAIVMLYYNMIIAWTIFYMFVSFNKQLPWERCDPQWRTPLCYSHKEKDECHSLYPDGGIKHHVLGQSSGIEETGGIRWPLALSLLAAWTIVFLCLCKGVQSSGKVALFPYVVLVILFIRGITLPGAMQGILFYVTPDWNRLFTPQRIASKPRCVGKSTKSVTEAGPHLSNVSGEYYLKDAIVVLLANGGTSIFSGFVIFSIIGYLAKELEVEVGDVVDEGVGLAFMVYPEVVARLPFAPLWSFLFFFMLLTLGLDSQFALLETVQTAILDRLPSLREHKFFVLLSVSIMGYLGGLIFCTQSGVYWLTLFDKYAANFSGILAFNWIQHKPATSGSYVYPVWANVLGWFIAFLPTITIIAMMAHTFFSFKSKGTLFHRLTALMQPMESWGPTHKNLDLKSTEITTEGNGALNNGLIRENSFDNPSFNVTYTFETAI